MSLTEMESYRELILENIEYDCLKQRFGTYREDLDEIVELLVETVCAKRKTTRMEKATTNGWGIRRSPLTGNSSA